MPTKVKTSMIEGDIGNHTATNTDRVVLPKNTKTNLDALNRLEGNIVFDTVSKKAYVDNGTTLTLVGSGSGGTSSLIADSSADDATATIFVPYQDSSGARPTDGTGGTTTGITTTITSTNPLEGTKSYLLTKDASNRQGGGWAIPLTMPLVCRAKSLKISVDYIINSGTFVPGSSSTLGDVTWFIYDVTNGVLIEPSNIKMFSNSSTISDRFEATFQTSATGSSYRLIAHITSTSALAFELKLDNISVSPSNYVYGSPITDERDFTPTFVGMGTVSLNYAKWKRIGDRIKVRALFTTGTVTGVNATMTLPYSVPMNLTAGISPVGKYWRNVGTATTRKGGVVLGQNGTNTVFFGLEDYTTSGSPFDAQFGTTNFGSSELVQVEFEYTALGASSSAQMSDGYDARDVMFRVQANVSGVNPNNAYVKVTIPTVIDDTIGAYSAGRYTVQTAGSYSFSAVASVGGANVLATIYRIAIYKNGAIYAVGPFVAPQAGNGFDIFVDTGVLKGIVGDYFEVFFYGGGNNSVNTLTLNGARFSGSKNQGGPTIAASEMLSAVAKTGAGQSIANNSWTIIDFATKEIDTNGSITTGASWRFTSKTATIYEISGLISFAAGGGWAATEYADVAIWKNGSIATIIGGVTSQATHSAIVTIPMASRQIQLNAEEYIDIRVLQTSGAALALQADALYNWVSIKRVK